MSTPGRGISRALTRALRRHLVGPRQEWTFRAPACDWAPPTLARTSLYLHVPFCREACPYCPYTKLPYREDLVEPYTRAALAEVDLWADAVGPAEVTSVYVGGGTPTLALGSVARVLARVRERFRVTGDVAIETSPAAVDEDVVARLRDCGVALVSLGAQSFRPESLHALGRRYTPETAERALALLANAGFASVNADLMFALPGQSAEDVIADLDRAVDLGANQVTAYPLFTFPYTAVGEHLRLAGVRLPNLAARHGHYVAIERWAERAGFARVSVWGWKKGEAPRYSSVTRDGYMGVGPGAGSRLPCEFILNSFDLEAWQGALGEGRLPVALRLPFADAMSGWWWLYWRLYDTRIPLNALDAELGGDAAKARHWLGALRAAGLARRENGSIHLTDAGAFWLHLAQNHFALSTVNALWTAARREPWPTEIRI